MERPESVAAADHLFLGFNDIVEPMEGMTPPAPEHVEALLGFVGRWERTSPIVIHCFAGISRSTAAAFITACALSPERDEADIANRLRAASPSATPNALLVAMPTNGSGGTAAWCGRSTRSAAAAWPSRAPRSVSTSPDRDSADRAQSVGRAQLQPPP